MFQAPKTVEQHGTRLLEQVLIQWFIFTLTPKHGG